MSLYYYMQIHVLETFDLMSLDFTPGMDIVPNKALSLSQ